MPPLLASQMRQGDPGGAAEGPDPADFDTFQSGIRVGISDAPVPRDLANSHDYFELMRAVGAINGKSLSDYRPWSKTLNQFVPFSSHLDVYDLDAVWADIAEIKRRDPAALPGITTRAEYEKAQVVGGAQIQRDRARLARGPAGAAFAGQMVGGLADPSNYLGVGAAAKTLTGTMLLAAAENAGIEIATEGLKRRQAAQAGRERTVGDLVWDAGAAAAGGAVIGGAVRGVTDNWASIKAAPKAVQEKVWAQILDKTPGLRDRLGKTVDWDALDRALPDVAEAVIGRENMSVAEKGAVDVLRREAEIDVVIPFMPTGAGQAAHRTSLAEALERISETAQGRPAPRPVAAQSRGGTAVSSGTVRVPGTPGRIGYANDVYRFFRSKGLSDAQARGIAAGIHAESASDHNVRGGFKGRAIGLGQWLGPRRAKLIARYGENPTRQQQLDFLWEELQGGDPGGRAVLAATDEKAVLDAYIRKFMRPARGAETTGDLKRGMQALGRGGEDIRVDDAPARGDGVDPEAEVEADLARRRAQLEVEEIRLEADAAAARAADGDEGGFDAGQLATADDLADVPEIDIMPVLRRDQFSDDASWEAAQAAVDAERLKIEGPSIEADVPPGDPAMAAPGRPTAEEIAARLEVVAERSGFDLRALRDNFEAWQRRDGEEAAVELLAAKEAELGIVPPVAARPGQDMADLPPDLRPFATPIGVDRDGRHSSGFYRFETPHGAMSWAPATGHANGAIARRTGVTADDVRAAIQPAPGRVTAGGELYDTPGGEGARMDAEALRHDLLAAIDAEAMPDVAFLAGDGVQVSAARLLMDLDSEQAALAALRGCL